MAICTNCSTEAGAANLCPACGSAINASPQQPIAQQAQPVTQQPVSTQQAQPAPQQPAYSQQAQQAGQQPRYPQPPAQKANPLMFIAGIVMIVFGIFAAISVVQNIFSFLDLVSKDYIALSAFPWAQVLFILAIYLVAVVTGLFALLWSKSVSKAKVLSIFAVVAGALMLINLAMNGFYFIDGLIHFGLDYLLGTMLILDLIPVPYILYFIVDIAKDVLIFAGAVVIFYVSLSRSKKAKQA